MQNHQQQQRRQPPPASPRDVMPDTWQRIRELSREWGKEHVSDCIRRGMSGEPGWFFAFEGGHVVGTPFSADAQLMKTLQLAVAIGGRFAIAMRPPATASADAAAPAGGANGAH